MAKMKAVLVEATFLDIYFGHSKGLKEAAYCAVWQTYVDREDFPFEASEITAWALDAKKMIAYEFGEPIELVREGPQSASPRAAERALSRKLFIFLKKEAGIKVKAP